VKTIKPQRLGLLSRVYEHKSECHFVVSILVFFPFEARVLLPEQKLWPFVGAELGKDAALDLGMPKPRAEVLVTGKGYALGGKPRTACSVRVRMGSIDKTLYVVGNRVWKLGGASDPEPFTEMAVSYQNAFGGPGFPQNPVGKGAVRVKGDKGESHPLPNIEDPKHLVRAPGDRPFPAGFGPFDMIWPQRYAKAGTYDKRWLDERFPGLADDVDMSMFNAAPEDQQVAGYLRGDETFSVENMHPDKPSLSGALPGVKTRCFITQRTAAGEVFREIATRLDTVHLFPHAERGIAIYRGVTPVAEDDGDDVVHALIAAEDMDAPKTTEHYHEVLTQRLDKRKGAVLALRDKDLMPDRPPSGKALPDETRSDMDALVATEGLLQKNMRRRLELEIEKAREKVQSLGLDPATVPALPKEEPVPDEENLAEFVAQAESAIEQAKEEIAAKRAEAEKNARSTCEQAGLDYDKVMADAQKNAGGPPKYRARDELAKLLAARDHVAGTSQLAPEAAAAIADPDLPRKLEMVEAQLFDAYRKFAHHYPAAMELSGDAAERVRAEVVAGHQEKTSFADRDLTGADLSGLDLSGADFKGALLEHVNFAGSKLAGAIFEGAVLVRANLEGTDLTGAKLKGANLGRARLHGTILAGGADLAGAGLSYADFSKADLRGADLSGADLFGATFAATDFSGVTAPRLNFVQTDLRGLKLAGAELSQSNFVEVDVTGVDFTGASLVSAVFVTAKGEGAVFRDAKLDNLRVVQGSAFPGADLRGARMAGANLRGTNLAGADLSGATLDGADLSACDLKKARFHRASAKGAMVVRADLAEAFLVAVNLMDAVLQKAKLRGADLRGSNLFRADLTKADFDRTTNFDEANVKHVRALAQGAHAKG
jgi:uncharacterized protein YjbI with pentapeptide repeats